MDKELLNQLLDNLNINYPGEYGRGDSSYIIDLDSDTNWGKIYTILDNSPDLYQNEENVLLTEHNSSLIYDYEDTFMLNLKADFDNEQYSLVISEI